MWRYNRLIRKGWHVITVDRHGFNGIYWTNVLMGKGGRFKTIRFKGRWYESVFREAQKELVKS